MLASAAAAAALLTVPVAWQRQPPQIEGHRAEDLLAAVETPLAPGPAPPADLAQLRDRIERLVQARRGPGWRWPWWTRVGPSGSKASARLGPTAARCRPTPCSAWGR